MTRILMFPGQSSRYPGMLERVVGAWPGAAAIVDEACDVLGRDLWAELDADRPDLFGCNRDIQIGVFLTSYLHQQALADAGLTGDLSVGLSLGEYNHLVHIGALSFHDALAIVDARGTAYDRGPDGMMASIFPLELERLRWFIGAVREKGVVEVANINSPSQNVIAGEHQAVEAVMRLIEDEEPAVAAIVIENRIPMHTPLFRSVSAAFRPTLDSHAFLPFRKPYIPNVLGEPIETLDAGTVRDLLQRHVFQPVHWRKSIDHLVAHAPDARFIEVGPGAVLYNLLQRRWHGNQRFHTDNPDRLDGRFARIAHELQHVA